LTEWTSEVYPGVALTPEDRAVVEKLSASADDRLQIEELQQGLRVRTRSWVGVVRLPTVEIRVVPKVTGDLLGLVRLLEYASGLDALIRLQDGATLEASGDSLLELVVLLFVEASERVLRRGLLSGYVEREDDLPIVRGRILGDRQMLKRFGRLDRIICRFDELEHDVVENQLLTAALQVASPRVTSVGLQRRISRLRGVLEPICDTDQLDLAGTRTTMAYNRLNAHYETAHQLGWLLFDALGIDDLFAPGDAKSFSFLLNMNQLFERFVTRVVGQVLPRPGIT
jgi:5-methylcytosine-specific restriction enzyme subunit McrC